MSMKLIEAVREMYGIGEDRRGVTPVIGIILLIAITVILAGVTGAFVLDLTEPNDPASVASLSANFDEDTSELTITHDGGDAILQDELYIRGSGLGIGSTSPQTWQNLISSESDITGSASGSVDGTTAVVAEDSLTLEDATKSYELEVIWQSSETDNSQTLLSEEGPNAS